VIAIIQVLQAVFKFKDVFHVTVAFELLFVGVAVNVHVNEYAKFTV
jgi:hypothetical protein